MYKFKIVWKDSREEIVCGMDIHDTIQKAGYGPWFSNDSDIINWEFLGK